MRGDRRSPRLARPLPLLLVVTRTTAGVAVPTLAVRHDRPDGAVLEFVGPWQSQHGLAEPTSVLDELRSRAIRHVAFDAGRITAWDSGLVTFVLTVLREAAKLGVDADRAGLPDGVQRLVALAEAVPERQTGRSDARPPWLARIGASTIARACWRSERCCVDARAFVPLIFSSSFRIAARARSVSSH